jgi:hypothetical protein
MKIFVYEIEHALDRSKIDHPYYACDESEIEILEGHGSYYSDLNCDHYIWKNHLDEDIVGKIQYRKWPYVKYIHNKETNILAFIYDIDLPLKNCVNIIPNEATYRRFLSDHDICLLKPQVFIKTIYDNFKGVHDIKYFNIFKEIVCNRLNCEKEWDEYFMKNSLFIPANIYVAKSEIIKPYYDWLFPCLEEFCKISKYKEQENVYQRRMPGYLAERMLGFHFMKLHQDMNVLWMNNNIYEAMHLDKEKKYRFTFKDNMNLTFK